LNANHNNQNSSVWASLGILSQFVEANRWYATSLIQGDLDNSELCGSSELDFVKYRDVWLWGNTPLNLVAWADGWLQLANTRYDRGWISNYILQNLANFPGIQISAIW
jgi:hypothetical protein